MPHALPASSSSQRAGASLTVVWVFHSTSSVPHDNGADRSATTRLLGWLRRARRLGRPLGPATRIPALIISPFARRGYVDHTAYDTSSIQKLIIARFGLEPLPGLREKIGDLTNALDLP